MKLTKVFFIQIVITTFAVLFLDGNSLCAQTIADSSNLEISDSVALSHDYPILDDSVKVVIDSTKPTFDSVVAKDSTANDSLSPQSRSAIESRIDYKAKDSLFFDLRNNRAYLYEDAQMNYKEIELTAARIEMNFVKREVSAYPYIDSTGKEIGVPHFDDKQQAFDAKDMIYNFDTKKARITNMVTKQDEMFVHGEVVKKLPNNEAFVKNARFTTCDLEHPHFYIVALKAKIIPEDKVVTGPAMLFLNDVPTPIVVPFGLFPNSNKHKSGVIIPAYGESASQGFFLRNGGFYWSINDYMDWKITGSAYTRGEWDVQNVFNYAKRYKFNGGLSFSYGMVPTGEPETPDYSKSTTLRVAWNHRQDPKANQNSTFSANVDFFNSASQQNSAYVADHFNNQSNSSIAYQLRIANRFNIVANSNMNYNTSSRTINATLPTLSFSMNPIYPFKRKTRKGAERWYESFKLNYSMNAVNRTVVDDTLFGSEQMFKDMDNSVKHNIPLEMNIKLFKGKINWNHSANYTNYWYFKRIEQGLDSVDRPGAEINQTHGFYTAQSYNYSTNFQTTLYGMLQFKRGFFRAFRHVMTPSVGFSYRPNFNTYESGYREYEDTTGRIHRYNLYTGAPAGVPGGEKSGSINFGLSNNFEMKVRDRKDTVAGTRKIKLIESLSLSASYNLAADSLNWSPISLTASTTLFKGLSLNYRATFSMYAKDSNNRDYNKFIWQTGNKFLLRTTESLSTGLNWSFGSKEKVTDEKTKSSIKSANTEIFERPASWGMKWSMNINYTVSYGSTYRPGYYYVNIFGYPIKDTIYRTHNASINQTLSINGSIELTEKWKIDFNSGFDFRTKKISQTLFTISRDLHCWNMTFTWVPFGPYKEWSFGIRLNSNMLGDAMKYDKRSGYRDHNTYN